jgi:hypothetical protein
MIHGNQSKAAIGERKSLNALLRESTAIITIMKLLSGSHKAAITGALSGIRSEVRRKVNDSPQVIIGSGEFSVKKGVCQPG